MARLGGSKPVEQESSKSVAFPSEDYWIWRVMLLFHGGSDSFRLFDGFWKQAVHFKTQLKLYLIGSPDPWNSARINHSADPTTGRVGRVP